MRVALHETLKKKHCCEEYILCREWTWPLLHIVFTSNNLHIVSDLTLTWKSHLSFRI